ncbi:hypothetical protein [Desulfovibrio ferrophilus]|uniref:Putative nima-interacting protein n=1 Tax=Desulfovibrio ferrophilus TaxID=241368 RepID=A0A2Z6AY49_9BACT|nr:hypothetical protein [Desulfovibrio ferrophilus]BBD08169.1 putative nima-interacting protein [Desulfovibrio ferrophilus]
MHSETCSMHCGNFTGVDDKAFAKRKGYLDDLFNLVEYEADTGALNLCGARGVSDSPADLTSIFDELARVLGKTGKGRLMINCGGLFEACYFRAGMWKLMAIGMPEDPFDGLHLTD